MTARPAGGFGGDEEQLSPFTTADPIPDTKVRRDADGFVRALALHTVLGLLQVGEIQLHFPLSDPPTDTFLKHDADGNLEWAPPAALSGAVEWAQIINTPSTLIGYGIVGVYTAAQVDALLNALAFADIDGVAAKSQLPPEVAYENEANNFGANRQTIRNLRSPKWRRMMRFTSHG